jgi:hypothetical protein
LELQDKLISAKVLHNFGIVEPNVSRAGKYTRWDSEIVVHPATLSHPNPMSVLVIGGSKHDGYVQAVLSEVLKHNTVRRVAVLASLLNKKVHDFSVHQNASSSVLEQLEYFDSFEDLLLLKNHYYFTASFLYVMQHAALPTPEGRKLFRVVRRYAIQPSQNLGTFIRAWNIHHTHRGIPIPKPQVKRARYKQIQSQK